MSFDVVVLFQNPNIMLHGFRHFQISMNVGYHLEDTTALPTKPFYPVVGGGKLLTLSGVKSLFSCSVGQFKGQIC